MKITTAESLTECVRILFRCSILREGRQLGWVKNKIRKFTFYVLVITKMEYIQICGIVTCRSKRCTAIYLNCWTATSDKIDTNGMQQQILTLDFRFLYFLKWAVFIHRQKTGRCVEKEIIKCWTGYYRIVYVNLRNVWFCEDDVDDKRYNNICRGHGMIVLFATTYACNC